jgi:hypothetical protein
MAPMLVNNVTDYEHSESGSFGWGIGGINPKEFIKDLIDLLCRHSDSLVAHGNLIAVIEQPFQCAKIQHI